MAEVNLGDLTAYIKADLTHFQRGMQQAQQALAQLQQSVRSTGTQTAQTAQANQHLTQSLQQITQATRQTTQAAQSNTQATLAGIQAQRQTTQAAQQTTQALAALAQGMQSATQATQAATQAGQGWQQVFAIAGGIGIATSIQGIVSALKNLAVETVQVGARFEQLQTSLNAIAGGSANGARQFQFIVETAQRLGLAIEPLAQGWRQLTAAASQTTLTLAEQQRLFTAVATEGRRVGATSQEMQRAFTALAQVASKGTLSMEELRGQLGEALPTAMGALAKGMGLTTEALTKLVSTGSVGVETFARALTRGLEQVQASSGTMAETSTTAFQRMLTEFKLLAEGIMNSGLAQYLKTVAENFAEAARWTRETFFPKPPVPGEGPTVAELGVTPSQQQQLMKLDAAIARAQQNVALARQATAGMRPGEDDAARLQERLQLHERTLQILQEQRTQLLEGAQATQAQADAQGAVKQATIATNATLERQQQFNRDFAKTLEDIARAEREFRERAAQAPQRLGAPTGTPEQVQEFNRNLQQALTKQLEALDSLVQNKAKDVQVTEEQRQALARYDALHGQLTKNIDASREAEQKRQQAAREAQQQAERAITQEIQLRAQLEQLKATFARPEESTAERARTQAVQQFVQAQRTIEQALKQLADNPALRERAPQLQQEFEALKAALPGAQEAAGLKAFNDAIEREAITPLERLAETYGLSKQARDADKASALEAAAANTIHAARAKELAEAIRTVALIEEQLPNLRRQAELSAPAGEAALKAVQDESAALQTLQEDLEQVRQAQLGQAGFPFGVSREELRLRQRTETDIVSPEGQRQREEILAQRRAQEQLNYGLELFGELAQGVGSAWTQALQSIAEGTRTVSEAFRAMGQAILQTMTQIAAQEATRAFIQLGFRLLTGALTTSVAGSITPNATQYASPIGPTQSGGFLDAFGTGGGGLESQLLGYQHGGRINRPTLAMLGENPAHNPEYVLNRQQMNAMMQSTPQAGGHGTSNVSILNFPSRAAAEEHADRERAQGRQVILNEVISDLSKGSGSQIGRMMRISQQ